MSIPGSSSWRLVPASREDTSRDARLVKYLRQLASGPFDTAELFGGLRFEGLMGVLESPLWLKV